MDIRGVCSQPEPARDHSDCIELDASSAGINLIIRIGQVHYSENQAANFMPLGFD